MIGYVTIGTNDLDRAMAFYDALFKGQKVRKIFATETLVTYGFGGDKPAFMVTRPFDGEASTPGNGQMIALNVDTVEDVKALHARALELGGRDEGTPGWRGDDFYGAYFRDLDGNKLNFYIWRS